jgi:predicted enzyme related to lactoylglutathione lyase
MARVIHFEIHADNPERATKFYRDVFGWEFNSWGGPMEYWLVKTGVPADPGIDGGLMRRTQPGAGTVNTIGVTSLDDSMKAVEAKGGKVVVPRMSIAGVGHCAYCLDTEGNTFGLIQLDSSAK